MIPTIAVADNGAVQRTDAQNIRKLIEVAAAGIVMATMDETIARIQCGRPLRCHHMPIKENCANWKASHFFFDEAWISRVRSPDQLKY